jgi:hypothetical protein
VSEHTLEPQQRDVTVEQRFDGALRAALVVETPAELSVRLLALAQPAPSPSRLDLAIKQSVVTPAPPELSARLQMLVPGAAPATQPAASSRRWVMPVYAATAVLLGVLVFFAAQAYGMALQELGVTELWRTAAALPNQWLAQFYAFFPQGQYVVRAFVQLQQALQWVLIGLLMWAVLEMRTPQRVRARA